MAPGALEQFLRTGIKVLTTIVYDSNEVLEAKLMAGGLATMTFINLTRFWASSEGGVYQAIDKSKWAIYGNSGNQNYG